MKWNLYKTVWDLQSHLMKLRDVEPRCVVCGIPLVDSDNETISYLQHLECERGVIDASIRDRAMAEIHFVYSFSSNPIICHHISYADDICVPVCHKCHGKIHGKAHQELEDLQPDMRKPCKDR